MYISLIDFQFTEKNSSVRVQKQRYLNSLSIQYLIIITCISYENIFVISVPKYIDIAPL